VARSAIPVAGNELEDLADLLALRRYRTADLRRAGERATLWMADGQLQYDRAAVPVTAMMTAIYRVPDQSRVSRTLANRS